MIKPKQIVDKTEHHRTRLPHPRSACQASEHHDLRHIYLRLPTQTQGLSRYLQVTDLLSSGRLWVDVYEYKN